MYVSFASKIAKYIKLTPTLIELNYYIFNELPSIRIAKPIFQAI